MEGSIRDKFIHDVLNQIPWEYVKSSFKTLNLPWYEVGKPTKSDLIFDLNDLIITAMKQPGVEIVTEHWTVCFWHGKEKPFIEVVFTPIIIFHTPNNKVSKRQRLEKLKNRLELAKKTENYELCSKIQKTIDKLKKSKIKN